MPTIRDTSSSAMDVDLRHLRTLQAIAAHGSFSRAAGTLHLSQPAVSHHIRHLESAFGAPLLERVGKRAFPTRAGELVLRHAERALAELAEAGDAIRRLRGVVAGRVRLGTGATVSTYLLPPILRTLRARFPELELTVVTGNAGEISAAVAANALDVGVVALPVSGRALELRPFWVDRLVAIGAPETAWRRGQALTPRALARHPLIVYESGGTIRRIIEAWFRRARLVPRITMELGNAEAIKRVVAAGLGVSIVSEISVRAEARHGTLAVAALAPALVRRVGIVRRRDKPVSRALEVVLTALAAGGRR
jgi:DNA-binding transcriptional LysR family regulator